MTRSSSVHLRSGFRRFVCCLVVAAGYWAVASTPAFASSLHPVSVTRAQLFVAQQKIQATVEVYFEDLYLFHQLQPNEADFLTAETLRTGVELHREFLARKFRLQLDDGSYLTPDDLPEVEGTIPADGVALGALMTQQLTFRFSYSLRSPIEHLTVFQEFTDASGILLSEMQLHVKQEGHEPLPAKVLSLGMPAILRFDWVNAPLSPEASAEERAAFEQRTKSELLGITNYSSVYSFLYIERNEVRHEILIPLMSLEQIVPMPRSDRNTLTISEQDQVIPEITRYFSEGNPIAVNGQTLEPRVDRVDFFGLSFRDFAVMGERRDVPVSSARVGIILSYPIRQQPQHVELTWDLFHKSLLAVRTTMVAPDQVSQHSLTRVGGRNRIEWSGQFEHNPIRAESLPAKLNEIPGIEIPIPAIFALFFAGILCFYSKVKSRIRISAAILCLLLTVAAWNNPRLQKVVHTGKRPPPSDVYSAEIVNNLMRGIYRSIEEVDESAIYDSLAKVTSEEVRQRVYLEMIQSLRMSEQGGALAHVEDIRIDTVSSPVAISNESPNLDMKLSDAAWSTQVTWTVAGTVEHWGHIHERINQFTADVTIDATPAEPSTWQIMQLDVTSGDRISFKTRLR